MIDPVREARSRCRICGERYWITYNGEVYNFRELREDLRRDGFRFVTETDTEVLLAMYARYGQGMLERLNGMFAFAIWDAESQELFLARDRLGIKPLYWARQDEMLCFASEVKALLPLLPRPRMRDDLVADVSDLPVGPRCGHLV